jgi:pSer/pThr/pTyr-binding forkhead associated (FHA) protein
MSREGDVWWLRDLGSKNGTKINGWRFIGAAPVRPGDLITFGRVSFRITVRH